MDEAIKTIVADSVTNAFERLEMQARILALEVQVQSLQIDAVATMFREMYTETATQLKSEE